MVGRSQAFNNGGEDDAPRYNSFIGGQSALLNSPNLSRHDLGQDGLGLQRQVSNVSGMTSMN